MACGVLNPKLPHTTTAEQSIWLSRWTSNLLNSQCLQDMCSTMCLPGHSPLSPGCLTCLERQGCSGTLNCLHCLGGNPDTLNEFEPVYNCTVASVAPASVAWLIIGCVFAVFMLFTFVYFVLWKTHQLPERWRLRADHYFFTQHEQHTMPVPQTKP